MVLKVILVRSDLGIEQFIHTGSKCLLVFISPTPSSKLNFHHPVCLSVCPFICQGISFLTAPWIFIKFYRKASHHMLVCIKEDNYWPIPAKGDNPS